jgi:hypothetical protein
MENQLLIFGDFYHIFPHSSQWECSKIMSFGIFDFDIIFYFWNFFVNNKMASHNNIFS